MIVSNTKLRFLVTHTPERVVNQIITTRRYTDQCLSVTPGLLTSHRKRRIKVILMVTIYCREVTIIRSYIQSKFLWVQMKNFWAWEGLKQSKLGTKTQWRHQLAVPIATAHKPPIIWWHQYFVLWLVSVDQTCCDSFDKKSKFTCARLSSQQRHQPQKSLKILPQRNLPLLLLLPPSPEYSFWFCWWIWVILHINTTIYTRWRLSKANYCTLDLWSKNTLSIQQSHAFFLQRFFTSTKWLEYSAPITDFFTVESSITRGTFVASIVRDKVTRRLS